MGKNIFVINTGSTSTKIAIFDDGQMLVKEELSIGAAELAHCRTALDQLDMRRDSVLNFLKQRGADPKTFDIIVARGGALPPIEGGAFAVNDLMVNVLKYAAFAQHASNLACMIGREIGDPYGIPVIIYDAPGADEFSPIAKITGLPEISIIPVSHVLNTRKVARDMARRIGKEYEACNFIVAHLGGGISINVHQGGKIIDSVYDDMGPMSPQRAGRIPTRFMTTLCYSGAYTEKEMRRRLTSRGGLAAHLGTQDIREAVSMIEAGDEHAREIFHAMCYGVAKGIGELSTVLFGKIDRIILTGGGAYSKMFTDTVSERVRFLAPVEIVPGEMEMEALAEGGLRVLTGKEPAKTYAALPGGYGSEEEFNKFFGISIQE